MILTIPLYIPISFLQGFFPARAEVVLKVTARLQMIAVSLEIDQATRESLSSSDSSAGSRRGWLPGCPYFCGLVFSLPSRP